MFTPFETIAGAVLLHLSTTTLLLSTSQILGVSSLLTTTLLPLSLLPKPSSSAKQASTPILGGIVLSALTTALLAPQHLPTYNSIPLSRQLTAGFLVGVGTKLATGCTSGHMLCGIPRLSYRSWVATAVFFSTAVATAAIAFTPPVCDDGVCYMATIPSESSIARLVGVVVAAYFGSMGISKLREDSETNRMLVRIWSGFLFGLGLIISGMASPAKTLGFMAVPTASRGWERFDPSLALVAVFGVGGNLVAWRYLGIGRNERKDGGRRPLLVKDWSLPSRIDVDWRLLVGSAVFGVGWGLAGVCPGPGVLGAALDGGRGLAWVGCFLVGQILAGRI